MKKISFYLNIGISFCISIFYYFLSNWSFNKKSKLSNFLISNLSQDQKNFFKRKIFIFKNQKELKNQVKNLKKELIELSNKNTELYLLLDVDKIQFENN